MAIDIEVIRRRVGAATPGPWVNASMKFSAGWRALVHAGRRNIDLADPRDRATDDTDNANAEFIAHAREDIPALIAEVERLRAMVGQHVDDDAMAASIRAMRGD